LTVIDTCIGLPSPSRLASVPRQRTLPVVLGRDDTRHRTAQSAKGQIPGTGYSDRGGGSTA